jgi:hypothetical protein
VAPTSEANDAAGESSGTPAPTTLAPTNAPRTPAPTTSAPTKSPQTSAPTSEVTPAGESVTPAPTTSTANKAATTPAPTSSEVTPAGESGTPAPTTSSAPTQPSSCQWWFNPNIEVNDTGACKEGGDIWAGTTRYCSYEDCCKDIFGDGQCSVVFPPSPSPEPTISPRPTTSSPTTKTPAPTSTPAPTTCEERLWYFNGKWCTNNVPGKGEYHSSLECCMKSGNFEQGTCAWCDFCKGGECQTMPPTNAPTEAPTRSP